MIEQWKPIVGFEGRYEVSNQGRVRNAKTKYVKSTPPNSRGYRIVTLTKDRSQYAQRKDKNATVTLHRAAAEAFVPRVDGKAHVNHIDGDKNNCAAANLEWCTEAENTQHAIRTRLWDHKNRSVAVVAESDDGLDVLRFSSLREASDATGVDQGSISKCISGHRKAAGGYSWRKA